MKETQFNIQYFYTCQNCGKSFISPKEVEVIEQDFYPVCSQKCSYFMIYKTIKGLGLTEENIKDMWEFLPDSRKSHIFKMEDAIVSLTKYFNKIGLANIKVLRLAQIQMSQLRDSPKVGSSSWLYMSHEPMSQGPALAQSWLKQLDEIFKQENSNKIHDERGLGKWT